MLFEELKENIKRHYGDSDEDLRDLGDVMDALEDLDNVDGLKRTIETMKLENEKALKDLDDSWRKRYRERFFDGDVSIPDGLDILDTDIEEKEEDITIEDYISMIEKKED